MFIIFYLMLVSILLSLVFILVSEIIKKYSNPSVSIIKFLIIAIIVIFAILFLGVKNYIGSINIQESVGKILNDDSGPEWIKALAGSLGLLGIILTINNTKKNMFINIITEERINWLKKLKESYAELCSYIYFENIYKPELCIETINYLIINLNPSEDEILISNLKILEKELINNKINEEFIIKVNCIMKKIELDFMVLFKSEWEFIKSESLYKGKYISKNYKSKIRAGLKTEWKKLDIYKKI